MDFDDSRFELGEFVGVPDGSSLERRSALVHVGRPEQKGLTLTTSAIPFTNSRRGSVSRKEASMKT